MKFVHDFRSLILGIVFLLPINLFGQEKNYNCKIFEQIAKDINLDKSKLTSLIGVTLITDPSTLKREVLPFKSNRSQKETDSIIAMFDSSIGGEIAEQLGDSLLLIDSLHFFTMQCGLQVDRMNFRVINKMPDLKFYGSKAVGILTSIGTNEDHLVVTILFPNSKCYMNYYFRLKFNEILLVKKKKLYMNRKE